MRDQAQESPCGLFSRELSSRVNGIAVVEWHCCLELANGFRISASEFLVSEFASLRSIIFLQSFVSDFSALLKALALHA